MTAEEIGALAPDEYRDYLLSYRGTGHSSSPQTRRTKVDIINICNYGVPSLKILAATAKPFGFGKMALIALCREDEQTRFMRWFYTPFKVGRDFTSKKLVRQVDSYCSAHGLY